MTNGEKYQTIKEQIMKVEINNQIFSLIGNSSVSYN